MVPKPLNNFWEKQIVDHGYYVFSAYRTGHVFVRPSIRMMQFENRFGYHVYLGYRRYQRLGLPRLVQISLG
jgi:hypothetical protein